jgi:hypothetical protein
MQRLPLRDSPRDPMRAVLLSLLVLAQLLLPTAFERVHASVPQLGCLAHSGGMDDPGKAPAHSHDQCTQCCLQHAPSLFPVTGPKPLFGLGNFSLALRVTLQGDTRIVSRCLPPPTGPPALVQIA